MAKKVQRQHKGRKNLTRPVRYLNARRFGWLSSQAHEPTSEISIIMAGE
jgi:hypothetical protein